MPTTIATYQTISANLDRSLEQTLHKPDVARDTDYYMTNISKVTSIDDFIGNYRLFSYAMKAFGLTDMTYAKAFMRKVLEGGVADATSFANKLVDTRYQQFATAFDFAGQGANATKTTAAQSGTVEKYVRQSLEEDVGKDDQGVQLALYFERKATSITSVYQMLADPALLKVAQTALGISPLTGSADVDKQAAMLAKGIDVADFQDPDKLHRFLQRFSAMWASDNGQLSASTAPSILISQPVEMGINADILTSLQNLKLGR
jgi:hypothetical protein